ncbi:MAG TPA: 4'-phosphopantetheinyl transferase superfamily protein [Candidatus Polarisedimenticolia bacterium]|nr:4'-phosphopantetheinyl transferase superfamily protein [Candidatus Polarisedimenticolia bacterium]
MSEAKARLHEVQVRFVRSVDGDLREAPAEAAAGLGAEERLHLARIRRAEERRDFLAAHALARRMLVRASGCLLAQLRFRFAADGRLEVAAPAAAIPFRVSLAHADGIALCAVALGRAVGACVESTRALGPLGMASSLCSLREQQAMRALTAGKGVESLASLWTLKEAIAKAARQGTSTETFEVGDASTWHVAVWRLTPNHFASVALPGEAGEGQVMHCEEDSPRVVPTPDRVALKRA